MKITEEEYQKLKTRPRGKTKPPAPTEAEIQTTIRQFLEWRGWFVYKNHQSMGSHKGIADLTAIKDHQVVWVEIKSKKGNLSGWQQQFKEEILAHGGIYIVATSVDDLLAGCPGL